MEVQHDYLCSMWEQATVQTDDLKLVFQSQLSLHQTVNISQTESHTHTQLRQTRTAAGL